MNPKRFLLLLFSLFALLSSSFSNCEESIQGFTYLGQYENAKYFISNSKVPWHTANTAATQAGGHLASISSQAENNFIKDNIDEIVLIGLSDEIQEGALSWANSEAVAFTSTFYGSNTEDNDFGVVNFWDGSWSLVNQWVHKKYILEVPCDNNPPNEGIVIANCPNDIEVIALAIDNYNALVHWTVPTATSDCSEGTVSISQINGPAPGTNFSPTASSLSIVYEVTDGCGNVEQCIFVVNVYPEDDQITCASDITVTASGPNGATVEYDDPVITSYCSPQTEFELLSGFSSGEIFPIGTTEVRLRNFLNGSPAFCQNSILCTFNVTVLPEGSTGDCPTSLDGFSVIGEFDDSKYFLSDHKNTWEGASTEAADLGGTLASISSSAENDFLKSNIDGIHFIGLNDANSEGSFQWDSGENFGYSAEFYGPNNEDNDYALINFWDGSWTLANASVQKRFIVEIACGDIVNPPPPPSGDFCAFNKDVALNETTSSKKINITETSTGLQVNVVAKNTTSNMISVQHIELDTEGNTTANSSFDVNGRFVSNTPNKAYQFNSNSPTSFTVSRVNSNGDIDWTTDLAVQANDPSEANLVTFDLMEMSDHIQITGVYTFNQGQYRWFAFRLNLDGSILWQKIYDNFVELTFASIQSEAADGGTYIALDNFANRTIKIAKIKSNGDFGWSEHVAGDLVSNRVKFGGESADGLGYFFAVSSFGNARADITKLNPNSGGLIWKTKLGDEFGNPDDFYVGRDISGIQTTSDGGVFVMTTLFNTSNGGDELYYGRLNSAGTNQWHFTTPAAYINHTPALQTSDNGFILADLNPNQDELNVIYINEFGSFEPNCDDVPPPPGGNCDEDINGFSFIGSFNGSNYFLSNTDARPVDAQMIAESNGGYLTVINSQEENDFLEPKISGLAYIGLNDYNNEGQLVWNDGANNTFSNMGICNICQPNSDDQDFVVMHSWDGKWSWSNFYSKRPYIMEIPCGGVMPRLQSFLQANKLRIVEAFPNPAMESINITLISADDRMARYQIYDGNGRMVDTGEANLIAGENTLNIRIRDFAAGLYTLQIVEAAAKKSSLRFMRIH